jgi:hypothetical protein
MAGLLFEVTVPPAYMYKTPLTILAKLPRLLAVLVLSNVIGPAK